MSSLFRFFICCVFQSFVINAQEELIYNFEFDTEPIASQYWTHSDPNNVLYQETSGNWCQGLPCWGICCVTTSTLSFSTVGYHSVRMLIDVRWNINPATQKCYVGFKTNTKSESYTALDGGLETVVVPNVSSDYDNNPNFQIQLYTDATQSSKQCYYDNLRLFGTPYTTLTTANPSQSSTEPIALTKTTGYRAPLTTNPSQLTTTNKAIEVYEKSTEQLTQTESMTTETIAATDERVHCKGVEFSKSETSHIAYPLDVCWGETTLPFYEPTHYWYYCKSDDTVWIAQYNNDDCSGYPISETALSDTATSITAYCDLEPCDYILYESFQTSITDCDEDNPTVTHQYSQKPYVSGYCNDEGSHSERYTCFNDNAEIMWYRSNGDDECAETNPDWITDITFNASYVYGVDYGCGEVISGFANSGGNKYDCKRADFDGLLNEDKDTIATTDATIATMDDTVAATHDTIVNTATDTVGSVYDDVDSDVSSVTASKGSNVATEDSMELGSSDLDEVNVWIVVSVSGVVYICIVCVFGVFGYFRLRKALTNAIQHIQHDMHIVNVEKSEDDVNMVNLQKSEDEMKQSESNMDIIYAAEGPEKNNEKEEPGGKNARNTKEHNICDDGNNTYTDSDHNNDELWEEPQQNELNEGVERVQSTVNSTTSHNVSTDEQKTVTGEDEPKTETGGDV